MCWSKHEREEWERRELEREAERLRFISTTEPKAEEPEPEVEEREAELVRS
ncbi:MAG TPA: hypothetical protein VHQ98_10385 [Gaiellaceae bacterium]|jgi:hypothetical protein|nr:hypothetical protein [Gaiellaceae bacterium]